MTRVDEGPSRFRARIGACDRCLRRSRLLEEVSGRLATISAARGALDDLLALSDRDLIDALASPGRDRSGLRTRHESFDVAGLRARCRSAGIGATCRHERDYPPGLRDLAAPPAALFSRGAASARALAEAEPMVAVVGARRASPYGLEVARALGRGLAAAGVPVVSGMALGIDSAAHDGALAGGGPTVAVLAGGVDVAYPRAKRQLHARIVRAGIALSEMPPGAIGRRWGFPARNRIIAALSAATIVVEAAKRSGALITARNARELGRDVAAVPGQVTSPLARGTNELIRDGAHLVAGARDVLDLVFGVGARPPPPRREAEELEPRLRAALAAVREGRGTVSEAAAGGAEGVGEAMAALAELELRGLVRRGPGGRYVAVA